MGDWTDELRKLADFYASHTPVHGVEGGPPVWVPRQPTHVYVCECCGKTQHYAPAVASQRYEGSTVCPDCARADREEQSGLPPEFTPVVVEFFDKYAPHDRHLLVVQRGGSKWFILPNGQPLSSVITPTRWWSLDNTNARSFPDGYSS